MKKLSLLMVFLLSASKGMLQLARAIRWSARFVRILRPGVPSARPASWFVKCKIQAGWYLYLRSIYRNLILAPKAGAQLAKTVLGPVTHMRNFLSAAAFAGANGVLLNNELGALKKAWESSMGPALAPIKLGKEATPQAKAFYNKLLNLGVVNTNVSLGDLTRLMKDVRFGRGASVAGLKFVL